MTLESTDFAIPTTDDPADQPYQACAQLGIRYAMALLHNESDAEEAVQETFCRMHAARQSGSQVHSNFRASFLVTLRNHCIDLIRRRRIRREYTHGADFDRVHKDVPTFHEFNETSQAIEQALSQLPECWRRSLELRVHGNLSYDEIAQVTGSTRNQIRTWIYRARRAMEEKLTAQGVLYPITEKQIAIR